MRADRQLKSGLDRLATLRDQDSDTSDIADATDWSRAGVGKFYRPV